MRGHPNTAPPFVVSPTYVMGVIDQATPAELELGLEWYDRERGWVDATAYVYDTTPEQVAAITATLSNNMPWDEASTTFPGQQHNKLAAITVLDLLADHPEQLYEAKLFATQLQRRKCAAIYEDPDFTLTPSLGPKVFPFACNLTGDLAQFTCDQYVWGSAIGWLGTMRKLPAITQRRREQAEAAYLWVAEQMNVPLAKAQAVGWVVYRRIRREMT